MKRQKGCFRCKPCDASAAFDNGAIIRSAERSGSPDRKAKQGRAGGDKANEAKWRERFKVEAGCERRDRRPAGPKAEHADQPPPVQGMGRAGIKVVTG
jgi:hypothetical protein